MPDPREDRCRRWQLNLRDWVHTIFSQESYWQTCSKIIFSADLFEDRVTAHPMSKFFLPHLVVEPETDSQLLSYKGCSDRVRTSEWDTTDTKTDNQKSHHVVASNHLQDHTNKAIFRAPISSILLCLLMCFYLQWIKPGPLNRRNPRAMESRGHRFSPECFPKSGRSYITLCCQLKRKAQPLLTHSALY